MPPAGPGQPRLAAALATGLRRLGRRLGRLIVVACSKALVLLVPAHAGGPPDAGAGQAITAPAGGFETSPPAGFPMDEFLDRLMIAESGGQLRKKNPRSTALGPFQFIESTFLSVVGRHFPAEVGGMTEEQVLALRTDMAFARRAAGAYAGELISALRDNGLHASTVNVRLAFLVGPSAAVRLLRSPHDRPVRKVLSAEAIAANPYMSAATVAKLVRRAAIDMSASVGTSRLAALDDESAATAAPGLERDPAGTLVASADETPASPPQGKPAAAAAASELPPAVASAAPAVQATATVPADVPAETRCDVGLASCRKWIALQERRAALARSAEQ